MADDKVFYPRMDRVHEDLSGNNTKRLRINRVVSAPQEGDEYEMDDDDNHKKSKPNKAIKQIIEDTRKEIEDKFREELDNIMSQDIFKNLEPKKYESKKNAISRYLKDTKYKQLLNKTTLERINTYKSHQRQLPTTFGFSEKEEPFDPDERHNLWKTPDEMKKTQEEINDLGRKLIAKGKKLSPKFFGELENYSSDEDEDETSISTNPTTLTSSSSSSSALTPSLYPLKSILKRKREGGYKTKKNKKSRAKKSKAKKSKTRKNNDKFKTYL
jgi:hypothetical protein